MGDLVPRSHLKSARMRVPKRVNHPVDRLFGDGANVQVTVVEQGEELDRTDIFFKIHVQSGASGEGLGWVDLDLGCSTILLGL